MDSREEIHEIEFISLYAFVARERERLRTSVNPRSHGVFTRNDLEMAYAFRQQMTAMKRNSGDVTGRRDGNQHSQHLSPSHVTSLNQRASYYIPKSQTEGSFNQRNSFPPPPNKIVAQSVRITSPQQHTGAFSPSILQPGQLFPSSHGNQGHMTEDQSYQQQRQSMMSGEHVPLGERLAARRMGERCPHFRGCIYIHCVQASMELRGLE